MYNIMCFKMHLLKCNKYELSTIISMNYIEMSIYLKKIVYLIVHSVSKLKIFFLTKNEVKLLLMFFIKITFID